MKTIRIMNDFIHSPIWTYENGIIIDDLPMIENDGLLQDLARQIEEMYTGYYEFDSHDLPCWFNEEKEKADKEIMLDLITKLVARLNEINDGSFVIEDLESDYLKKL